MAQKVKLVCPKCGSEDISRDASAHWSVETQSWEISGVFDDMSCNYCDAEFNEAEEIAVLEEQAELTEGKAS
jgi:hypothetical protein